MASADASRPRRQGGDHALSCGPAALAETGAHHDGPSRLLPSACAPRERVEARRRGTPFEVRWGGPTGEYVAFPDAQATEVLELTWSLVRFRQRVTLEHMERSDEDRAAFVDGPTYTFDWTGSTVTAVEPEGEWLPLHGRRA